MSNKSSPHGGFISEGTIIHGTLRTQDLLLALADELNRVLPFSRKGITTMVQVTHIYYGLRDAVIAETSCPDFYAGKYLVYPIADVGQFDAIGVNSKKDLRLVLNELRAAYPQAAVYHI